MIYLLDCNTTDQTPWYQIGSNIASMIGSIGVILAVITYFANRNVRNIQLMQRCIDNYRKWVNNNSSKKQTEKIDSEYLQIIGEELFYFQRRLLDEKIVIEWMQGIIDFIQVFAEDGSSLNVYNNQIDIRQLIDWKEMAIYSPRIEYFIKTNLNKKYTVPGHDEPLHFDKKRQLAKALYKHIKNYKY